MCNFNKSSRAMKKNFCEYDKSYTTCCTKLVSDRKKPSKTPAWYNQITHN